MNIALTSIMGALCVGHHCQIEFPCTDCAETDYKTLWRYRCDLLATIIPRSTLKILMYVIIYVNKERLKTWGSQKGKGLLHIILSNCSPADDVLFSTTFAAFHLKREDPGFLIFVPVVTLLYRHCLFPDI